MNKKKNHLKKGKDFHASLQKHLSFDYRNQYNLRRIMSCLALFVFLRYYVISSYIEKQILMGNMSYSYYNYDERLIILENFIPLVWSIAAYIFWHYAYWSFQDGIIDSMSKALMAFFAVDTFLFFGSIFSLIFKVVVQNLIILIWVAFIAPVTGFLAWRRAVKRDEVLY